MKTVSLSGSKRSNVGSKDAAALRANGQVPCVIYGGTEQVHFSTDEKNFKNIIYTPEVCLVEIEVEGKKHITILQDAQYHRVSDKLIHADFLEVIDGKPITMHIPVKLHGQSEGVKAGGKLILKTRKLKARGLANNMPNNIDVQIDNLQIGGSITVGEVKVEGIELLNAKNVTVVSVQSTRAVAAAEAGKDDKKAPGKK
jgi:large subunit ribosomal protein L25